jgi:NADH-quinone oxidoreductase subunit K
LSGKIFFCAIKKEGEVTMGQEFVLLISASIFCVGTVGFIIRKNPLIMFMSVELMLNSVNFLLISYSSFLNSLDGQIFALFIMTVAAAEVVVGLAIILTIFRTRHDMDVDHIDVLKG